MRRDDRVADGVGPEYLTNAVEKRAPPALGVEADDVIGAQPGVNGLDDRLRQHTPRVGRDPRNVDEVHRQRLGAARAQERRRHVEVVVVEEDRRARHPLELLGNRVGEAGVHGHVAPFPGRQQVGAGIQLQVPEAVLDEPERRVRDHVVEEVVGDRVVLDEPEAVARAVARDLLQRACRRERTLLCRRRARDPRDVMVGQQAA